MVLDDDKKEAAWQQKVSVVVLVSVPIFTTSLFLTTEKNFFGYKKRTKNVGKTNTCFELLTHFFGK